MLKVVSRRSVVYSRTLQKAITGHYQGNIIAVHNHARCLSSFSSFTSSPFKPEPLPVNFGLAVVPQQKAWLVERFGKFHRALEPGLHILIPVVDRVRCMHCMCLYRSSQQCCVYCIYCDDKVLNSIDCSIVDCLRAFIKGTSDRYSQSDCNH